MCGNSFQALLTDDDQEKMLSYVKSHLNKNGVFIFNTRNSSSDELRTTQNFEFWYDFIDHRGRIVKVFGKQVYNTSKRTVTYTTKRIWSDAETITEIELRFVEVEDLIRRLDKCGFEAINLYGGFYKNPFTEASKNIIISCRAKL